MSALFVHDAERARRIGLPEAILCASKTPEQLVLVLERLVATGERALLTRLPPELHAALPEALRRLLDYDPISRTAFLGVADPPAAPARVAVVAAGTGDQRVAEEAVRTLAFHGEAAERHYDVGVAGLWRLLERRERLAAFPVVIACAGMEGALFSVLGGLVPGLVVAVPVSHGYGVAEGGRAALASALSSCAPGVAVVNIDNGFGAACVALRALARGR
ncbi:MAG: nickel pincer cofactor biosynthesis protein LarB [Geminicoccaceae bacterium]|nr:nickel pincer cofactor biosynthesis protein LarB [Geminicoccaceae bacterium]MCS7266506.1 nickel pincer cofactor biosynthesis protein LarB [Geminicoccaceae bacterium]MCX7630189.1 nickel pincer cofactor biosynthesis protein LarB [Geminicoccaceae bacterium]MDW8123898.1 nickel pincer cofactor biosynthesis protein LarB [Geminicoccaceae bacterium]MDW8340039.1 nickel pincer cofactor biosynthesis protein LarB [Geminicoccaceae bacterium]